MDTRPVLISWRGQEFQAEAEFSAQPRSNLACMDPRSGAAWAWFDVGGRDWKCLYALEYGGGLAPNQAPMSATNSPLATLEREGVRILDCRVLKREFLRMWEILEKLGMIKEE